MKPLAVVSSLCQMYLSVSSNGSTWVKLPGAQPLPQSPPFTFSILERIDVGETTSSAVILSPLGAFSILERIDVGETSCIQRLPGGKSAFSILERIDVGETTRPEPDKPHVARLSVSSNGSTWVKRARIAATFRCGTPFQYPRTDRRG